jgi:hypothetical protein
MCMREWKRVIEKEKEEKERRGVARKIWEGQIKLKKNKVLGRMSRCWEMKRSLFFQPCAIWQRGRHRCLVVIFSLPLHMSTILYRLILDITTYGLILMITGFER